jgi:hypothetical protein
MVYCRSLTWLSYVESMSVVSLWSHSSSEYREAMISSLTRIIQSLYYSPASRCINLVQRKCTGKFMVYCRSLTWLSPLGKPRLWRQSVLISLFCLRGYNLNNTAPSIGTKPLHFTFKERNGPSCVTSAGEKPLTCHQLLTILSPLLGSELTTFSLVVISTNCMRICNLRMVLNPVHIMW